MKATVHRSLPMIQPSTHTNAEIIDRIEWIRKQYGFAKPSGEAVLSTIKKANLIDIVYDLETEVSQLRYDKTPPAAEVAVDFIPQPAKKAFPATRAEFIAYNVKQTKTWLKSAIEKETGEGFGDAFLHTNLELTTKLADLQGWSDDNLSETEVEEVKSLGERLAETIKQATVDQAEAAKNEDRPRIDDKIPALLESMKTASSTDKKKIRTKLRALGYKLSEQKKGE